MLPYKHMYMYMYQNMYMYRDRSSPRRSAQCPVLQHLPRFFNNGGYCLSREKELLLHKRLKAQLFFQVRRQFRYCQLEVATHLQSQHAMQNVVSLVRINVSL